MVSNGTSIVITCYNFQSFNGCQCHRLKSLFTQKLCLKCELMWVCESQAPTYLFHQILRLRPCFFSRKWIWKICHGAHKNSFLRETWWWPHTIRFLAYIRWFCSEIKFSLSVTFCWAQRLFSTNFFCKQITSVRKALELTEAVFFPSSSKTNSLNFLTTPPQVQITMPENLEQSERSLLSFSCMWNLPTAIGLEQQVANGILLLTTNMTETLQDDSLPNLICTSWLTTDL